MYGFSDHLKKRKVYNISSAWNAFLESQSTFGKNLQTFQRSS